MHLSPRSMFRGLAGSRSPGVARRAATVLAGFAVALALIVPATASAAGFTVHVDFDGHHPVAGKPWPISVTATKGRQKLDGTVKYVFVTPVGNMTRPGHKIVDGTMHDTMKFPGDAVGHRLGLKVVITTKDGTDTVNWWVSAVS